MRTALWAVRVLIDRAQEGVALLQDGAGSKVHVQEDLAAAKDVLDRLDKGYEGSLLALDDDRR